MKKPNEIFGFPTANTTSNVIVARKKYNCPYLSRRCNKISRGIKYPMGVCSAVYNNEYPIICPQRFLENNMVFVDVCNEIFGSTNNILVFSEVKIKNVGSFDFVLVKHKPISNEIEDFCIVELQSDSTTGTGKLVNALKDFMQGNAMQDTYNFGLNTYNTIKLSYIQMLIKGQVMEKWQKNIIWVMQKYVFDNMQNRFVLKNLNYDKNIYTKYFIYDLVAGNNIFNIKLIDRKSSTISNLLTAFNSQPIPNINTFTAVLKRKIQLNLGIRIH